MAKYEYRILHMPTTSISDPIIPTTVFVNIFRRASVSDSTRAINRPAGFRSKNDTDMRMM